MTQNKENGGDQVSVTRHTAYYRNSRAMHQTEAHKIYEKQKCLAVKYRTEHFGCGTFLPRQRDRRRAEMFERLQKKLRDGGEGEGGGSFATGSC